MAAYCDAVFYTEKYMGPAIPAESILQALMHGSFAVDQAVTEPIGTLTDWPEYSVQKIKLATCAMAAHWYKKKQIEEVTGGALSVLGGYSIGDVSVSAPNDSKPEPGSEEAFLNEFGLTKEAYGFLLPTGLLDRRVR